MEKNNFDMGLSFLAGAGISFALTCVAVCYTSWPKKVYFENDFDQDGTKDIVVERIDGYKIPLYGVNKEEKMYVTEEMLKTLNLKTDYKEIEHKLNERSY